MQIAQSQYHSFSIYCLYLRLDNYTPEKRAQKTPSVINRWGDSIQYRLRLVGNNLLGLFVEYVDLLNIQSELNGIARPCSSTRIYSCGHRELVKIEVQIYFCTK